jgi:hypothetical protein
VMAEPVRERLDTALAAAADDHLVDAAGGHRDGARQDTTTYQLAT